MKFSIETHQRRDGLEVLWIDDQPDKLGTIAYTYRRDGMVLITYVNGETGKQYSDFDSPTDLIPKPEKPRWEVWANEYGCDGLSALFDTCSDANKMYAATYGRRAALLRIWCEADGTLGIERVENSRDE